MDAAQSRALTWPDEKVYRAYLQDGEHLEAALVHVILFDGHQVAGGGVPGQPDGADAIEAVTDHGEHTIRRRRQLVIVHRRTRSTSTLLKRHHPEHSLEWHGTDMSGCKQGMYGVFHKMYPLGNHLAEPFTACQ